MALSRNYVPRVVDKETQLALGLSAAVVLEGAKGVGKTETGRQCARSEVLLDIDPQARAAASIDPALLLSGDKPRLLDEWQAVPELWNHVRRAVDAREGPFVLTGSAVPSDDAARHTGAGRFTRVRMRPMTLYELGHSSGALSLGHLLNGEQSTANVPDLKVDAIAEILCVGGWPALLGKSATEARPILDGYLDSISRTDIRRVDGVARDPAKVRNLIRSLARNVATAASLATLSADAGGSDGVLDEKTVRNYYGALQRLMVVEDQPAWMPALRSRSRLRSTPKRHFCDPSLAAAALGASPGRLLGDLNTLGFLFESLVVRDLRVYAQHHGATVSHYRDNVGEVDVIVEAGTRWGAAEVKLGVGSIDEAADNLKKFATRIDVERRGSPSFLGVIVPTTYGYVREDGIHVLPLQALAP